MTRFAFLVGVLVVVAGCADMNAQVKTRAAHDFSCGEGDTRIVDAQSGVYRIQGCGLEASYVCEENAALNITCEQTYVAKVAEPQVKPAAGASLAKSR